MSETQPVCIYEIDTEDQITAVNQDWVSFFNQNGPQNVRPDYFIGKSIWNFIQGQDTKSLYKSLFSFARKSKQEVNFEYRCDSPEVKRFMAMVIKPMSNNGLKFKSSLHHIEEQSEKAYFETANKTFPQTIYRCSMCNKFKFNQEWQEIDQAFNKGLMTKKEGKLMVAHTVCEPCRDAFREKVSNMRKNLNMSQTNLSNPF